MTMFNFFIKLILILLLIFTPIAFGSVELWAFSLMELGILLIIILWAIQSLIFRTPSSQLKTQNSKFAILFLSLFILLILFQLLPLPSGFLKIISPKTYALRSALSFEPSALSFPLSFVPFVTQIQFLKWLTLIGLFLFLLYWKPFGKTYTTTRPFMIVILVVGI
jgi:hypothetical protein